MIVAYALLLTILGIALTYEWLSGRSEREAYAGDSLEKVLVIIKQMRTPQPEDQELPHEPATEKATLEQPLERETPITLERSNVRMLKHKKPLEKPSKQQLAKLKTALGLTAGSLQYKKGSVYLVTYDASSKKHIWKRLGPWLELKRKLG